MATHRTIHIPAGAGPDLVEAELDRCFGPSAHSWHPEVNQHGIRVERCIGHCGAICRRGASGKIEFFDVGPGARVDSLTD